MTPAKILIVDDDAAFRNILAAVIESGGYDTRLAANGSEALQAVKAEPPDLMLLDLNMPDLNGIEVLKKALEIEPALAVVIISGEATIKLAVEATQKGACDFLEKPIDKQRVLLTVRNTLETQELRQQQSLSLHEGLEKYGMVGISKQMQRVFGMIDAIAQSGVSVLISGESGTGKGLVARALHDQGARAKSPLFQINCAAIPENLIESELFGHEKGAFTSAADRKDGYFHLADKGTLFLDEIADLSLAAQAKLLLTLEQGAVLRVGGSAYEKVDVRLMTASNKNLQERVDAGKFREDLYYRIAVVPIHLPPLRERREDIFPTAEHFIAAACEKNGIALKKLVKECQPILAAQEWPGNARELKNRMEMLAALTNQTQIHARLLQNVLNFQAFTEIPANRDTLREARDAFERSYIQSALRETDDNVTQTANLLGLERTHLYKIMERLGIAATDRQSA